MLPIRRVNRDFALDATALQAAVIGPCISIITLATYILRLGTITSFLGIPHLTFVNYQIQIDLTNRSDPHLHSISEVLTRGIIHHVGRHATRCQGPEQPGHVQ